MDSKDWNEFRNNKRLSFKFMIFEKHLYRKYIDDIHNSNDDIIEAECCDDICLKGEMIFSQRIFNKNCCFNCLETFEQNDVMTPRKVIFK